MTGAGDSGSESHQLDEYQRLLLDVMTTQMQRLLNHNNEELYRQMEGLEHQMNPNAGRPYGGNRRANDGPNQIEGQNKIEGEKLNVPLFKGRSDPDVYLDWEMKMALVRANIEEETEDTMAHFLSGLNPDIRDVVEL